MGDLAANGLQILRAKNYKELLGPYSRFEFNHPGPISFYYYAFMENMLWFIKPDHGKHLFSQLLINYSFLIISLHILYISVERKYYTLVLFVSVLFSLRPLGEEIYVSLWGPNILLFPMLLFVLSASILSNGQIKYLLFLIISASFIIQNHVGGLLIVLPFSFLALVLYFWNKKYQSIKISKTDLKYVLGGIIFLVVVFFPSVYEQFSSEYGNISKLFNFFLVGNRGIHHPLFDSANCLFSFYLKPINKIINLNAYILIALFMALSILNIKKENNFINYLTLFIFLGILLSLYGTMHIVGTLYDYLLTYEYIFVSLFYFSVLCAIIKIIKITSFKKDLIAIFLILASFILFNKFYRISPQKYEYDDTIDKLIEVIRPNQNVTYELLWGKNSPDHAQWPVATGLAYRLVKEGYKVCVPDEWLFMFGKQFSCKGKTNIKQFYLFAAGKHTMPLFKNSFTYKNSTIEFGGFNEDFLNKAFRDVPKDSFILLGEKDIFDISYNYIIIDYLKWRGSIEKIGEHYLTRDFNNFKNKNKFYFTKGHLEEVKKANLFEVITVRGNTLGGFIEQNKNNILILAVKDEATLNLSNSSKKFLLSIGSKIDSLKYRGSYVAVINKGKIVCEKIDNNNSVEIKNTEDKILNKLFPNIKVYIYSAGCNVGDNSSIIIDEKEYSENKRGVNIVILNEKLRVLETKHFETHERDINSDAIYVAQKIK